MDPMDPMANQVFDQARPRNPKAQLFADAFAGCDEWVVPPRKRRSDLPAGPALYDAEPSEAMFDVDFRRAA